METKKDGSGHNDIQKNIPEKGLQSLDQHNESAALKTQGSIWEQLATGASNQIIRGLVKSQYSKYST